MNTLKICFSISLLVASTFTSAAPTTIGSCAITDISAELSGGGSVNADYCINVAGNDGSTFSSQINGLFENKYTALDMSNYAWTQTAKDESGGGSTGSWEFTSQVITNPFIIVLKSSTFFAAYLFKQDSNGQGEYTTVGITSTAKNPKELSHASLYTNTLSPVPVPAAVFMFVPALLGFMGLRCKAKNSNA